jgi:polysaccharide transporter, PST family
MFSLTAAEIAGKGLAFVFTIYLLRTIGPENNGILYLAKSYVQVLLVLVWLGFEQVGVREVARDRSKMHYYVGTIISIRMLIALVCYAGLVIGLELFADIARINPTTRIVAYIYGLLLFGNAIFLNWVFQAIEKMHIIAIRSVLLNLVNLAGILIFVHTEDDLILAVWIITISTFLNFAWMLIYYIKQFGLPKLNFNLRSWGGLLGQSSRVGLVFLLVTLYNTVGVQVLTYFHGEVQTGIYGAAFQIIGFLTIPSVIIQGAFFPQISRLTNVIERNNMVSKYVLMNFLAGVAMSFSLLVFSDVIVSVLGEKYSQTNEIIKYLSLVVLIQYVSTSFSSPLIAWKKEKTVIYANIAGLIAVLIFSILLIPKYGYIGAAISAIACEGAVMIFLMIIYYRLQATIYSKVIFRILGVGIIAFTTGFILLQYGLNIYIIFLITITFFIILSFLFKILQINELLAIVKR